MPKTWTGSLRDLLLSRAIINWDTGCWEWSSYLDRYGYGRLRYRQGTYIAHRLTWVVLVGPVQGGLHLDHLCRVPRCINPAHLEPVTPRVNTLRGVGPAAANAVKTHCPQGHEYDQQNTYVDPARHRHCRACMRLRRQKDGDR